MTAQYISDKCGQVTIKVENNQMPLMPLFSPIYSSTRPYSQTKSSTQRALMMPDEIMRMDNKKCIVLLRGQKPLLLDKIVPEEFLAYEKLQYTRITDYTPLWREGRAEPNELEETVKSLVTEVEYTPLAQPPAMGPGVDSPNDSSGWYPKVHYALSSDDGAPTETAKTESDVLPVFGLMAPMEDEVQIQTIIDSGRTL